MSKNNDQNILLRFQNASRKYSDASAFMHAAIARKAGFCHKKLHCLLLINKLSMNIY